jgi:hypothetical protein
MRILDTGQAEMTSGGPIAGTPRGRSPFAEAKSGSTRPKSQPPPLGHAPQALEVPVRYLAQVAARVPTETIGLYLAGFPFIHDRLWQRVLAVFLLVVTPVAYYIGFAERKLSSMRRLADSIVYPGPTS